MLSLVLPLVVIAVALTPLIASARAVYEQEVFEQDSPLKSIELVDANVGR